MRRPAPVSGAADRKGSPKGRVNEKRFLPSPTPPPSRPVAMIKVTRVDKLRPADPSFIENLVRVFIEARRARLQFLIDLHGADDDRAFFANVVLPQNDVWLAESDGTVCGFIAVAPGWVNHLYVAPPFQQRGVGAELLDLAKRHNDSLQ